MKSHLYQERENERRKCRHCERERVQYLSVTKLPDFQFVKKNIKASSFFFFLKNDALFLQNFSLKKMLLFDYLLKLSENIKYHQNLLISDRTLQRGQR